jgi:hypothetical protein
MDGAEEFIAVLRGKHKITDEQLKEAIQKARQKRYPSQFAETGRVHSGSGLTLEEKRAARNSLDVIAHQASLPGCGRWPVICSYLADVESRASRFFWLYSLISS